MKGKQKFFVILILGSLSAIGPFSIDMYLPAFPDIAQHLHSTVANVSLSLSSFFIGISFGQLVYGPLLDRFGRKKPLYIGLSIYILASLGCVFAGSINILIALRLLQALGGCVGMVASRALIRDIFPVEENAKIFSLLMLVVGVSPLIAPTAGGYITAFIGWQYIFVVLAVMGTAILISIHFSLPEGRQADDSLSLKPKHIAQNFAAVFKEPQFYVFVFTGSLGAAGLYAYIAGSPLVFMQLFKVSEQHFGWIFAGVAMCLIAASQLNSLMLRRFSSKQIISVALPCQLLSALLLFAGSYLGIIQVWGTIILIAFFLGSQGFIFPNSSALSIAPFRRNAGTASALMGAIQMVTGTLSSAAVSFLSNGTALPMTGVMAACVLMAYTVFIIGNRNKSFSVGVGK